MNPHPQYTVNLGLFGNLRGRQNKVPTSKKSVCPEQFDSRKDGATKSNNVFESTSSSHKSSSFEVEPEEQRDSEEEEDDNEQR